MKYAEAHGLGGGHAAHADTVEGAGQHLELQELGLTPQLAASVLSHPAGHQHEVAAALLHAAASLQAGDRGQAARCITNQLAEPRSAACC